MKWSGMVVTHKGEHCGFGYQGLKGGKPIINLIKAVGVFSWWLAKK